MEPSIAALAGQLERKLRHIPEPQMRRLLVSETLRGLGVERAGALLAAVLGASSPRCAPRGPLREALHGALRAGGAEALAYELRSELYGFAKRMGDAVLQRLLRSGAPQEELPDAESQLPKELQDVPLGRRRELARGTDLRWLDQLRLDCDPLVIRYLLGNPHTREADVVRMAALRPVAASTLGEIAAHSRWSVREGVRVALVRNPYCPVAIAVPLVGSLPAPLLREMRRDPDLHPEVLRHAGDELERR